MTTAAEIFAKLFFMLFLHNQDNGRSKKLRCRRLRSLRNLLLLEVAVVQKVLNIFPCKTIGRFG